MVLPSSCLTRSGILKKLIKWSKQLEMKQLAPPSLCSTEVDTISKMDDGACASQALKERYCIGSRIRSLKAVFSSNVGLAVVNPVQTLAVGVIGRSKYSVLIISSYVSSGVSKGRYVGEVEGTTSSRIVKGR
jgi:hypothetical protein